MVQEGTDVHFFVFLTGGTISLQRSSPFRTLERFLVKGWVVGWETLDKNDTGHPQRRACFLHPLRYGIEVFAAVGLVSRAPGFLKH